MRRAFLLLLTLLVMGGVGAQAVPHDGEVAVPGLNDTVEILRDDLGVPHIYASNTYDLFFAQGFTQAQDRWWQMEFSRHTGRGAIQELTGFSEGLLGTDVFLRTLGFVDVVEQELAETYDQETLDILQAFADGVNAYIQDKEQSELAFEYTPLGLNGVEIEIEPWTMADTVVWGKVMSLDLSGNRSSELLFSRLLGEIDEDMLDDWFPPWPYGEKPTIVQPQDLPLTDETLTIAQTDAGITGIETEFVGGFTDESLAQIGIETGPGIGSNNWVVSGDLTESGMPLMANDMHLGLNMPSIWYEIGLHCQPVSEECPYNVTGFTFSTTPGVVAGHNDNIAWALTNVGHDTQDLYQIRVNPEDELQYEWDGEFRDMTLREEVIEFGDGTEPVILQVRETHLGPIINDSLEGFNNENPLALRWTALEPGTLSRAILNLNRANDWNEFREALTYWDVPAQNVIYADIEGNIGYQMPGKAPVRAGDHSGQLPVPGWTSEYEWRGYIPYDSLPRIFNPERGYISTANQAVVPLEYYTFLEAELGEQFGEDANFVLDEGWALGYRGERINTLLEDLAPHNIDTFQQMHADNYDGSAAEIVPFLAELEIEDDELADLRDWLLEWDYHMDADSPQAAFYAAFWAQLMDGLYNDQVAGIASASGGGHNWWATFLLMSEPENIWWDDINSEDVTENRDDILLMALKAAQMDVTELLGKDRDAWAWGDLHTITFVSAPIGQSGIALLENRVNRGPYMVGGTASAINALSWNATRATRNGDFTTGAGPSQRSIYDLSNWENSLTIHPTGQSGHPDSEHYDDMIPLWVDVDYHPMNWSMEQVQAAATDQLTLNPSE